MTKEQTSLIIGAVLSCVISILAVFGYNIVVVQPQLAAIENTQKQILGVVMAGQGEEGLVGQNVTGFNSVNVAQDLAVGDDLTVAGDATIDTMIVTMTNTERLQILAPTAQPTATPGLRINVAGVNEPLVIQKALTPVARVSGAGAATFESLIINGASTLTGAVNSATALLTGRQVVTLPTAQATATPGVYVNSAGAVSALQVWALNATPVASMDRAGKATLGSAVIGTSITHGDQSAVTVTTNGAIAITDDFVPLTAAGSVATSNVTGCSTLGKLSLLYNTANQTITITDTSTLKLAGNWAAGQYDSLLLAGDGTNCVEVARANN